MNLCVSGYPPVR